jgi:P-type E1-E2 ATPase
MIEITIPGHAALRLNHLVLDYNGTLACDGTLLAGVRERLIALSARIDVHVITADTFGTALVALVGIPCRVKIMHPAGQDVDKLEYIAQLGRKTVAAIGNGRNDRLMLQAAALGIVVIGPECAAAEALIAADIIAPNILTALDLLLNPLRLVATLRS